MRSLLQRLAQLQLLACVVLLAAITGLVFVAAIMRFFGRPLTWSVDMAQLLFIWLCFIGSALAMRQKGHLGMEVMVKHLGYPRQFWLEMACSLAVLAFLAVLTVEGVELTLLNRERTFGDSSLSYSWVTAAVPAGCVLLGLALAANMVEAWQGRSKGTLVYTPSAGDRAADDPPRLEI